MLISNPFLIVKPKDKVQYCSRCFARIFHFSHFYFYPIYPLLYCILLIFYVFMIISFFFLSLWFDFYNERKTGSNNRRLSTVSKWKRCTVVNIVLKVQVEFWRDCVSELKWKTDRDRGDKQKHAGTSYLQHKPYAHRTHFMKSNKTMMIKMKTKAREYNK